MGKPEVVADLGTGAALGQILVKALAPRAGEIASAPTARWSPTRARATTSRSVDDRDVATSVYFASGSGRNWNLTTELRVPWPPSMCQTAFGP